MNRLDAKGRVRSGLAKRQAAAAEAESFSESPPPPKKVPPIGANERVIEHPEWIVDLLNPKPAIIVRLKALRRELAFGFAGGDTVGIIRTALHQAPVEPSDWDPSCFEDGLFIPDLLATCMPVSIDDLKPKLDTVFLTRLLTHPPRDPEVVDFRREVLRELNNSAFLTKRFRQLYRDLYKLREHFDSDSRYYDPDGRQRRLETLGAVRDVIAGMAEGFSECRSGLGRLHRFAEYARETEGYKRLVALLDFDNHLSAVNLKLRIGADGQIRRFEVSRMDENKENHFYQTPFRRFLTRVRMLLRGYIFSEGELVNRWVDTVFDGIEKLLPPLIQTLGEMELYLIALSFKEHAESKGLSVCFPELHTPKECASGEQTAMSFQGLFNPLLFGQDITPVPCDFETVRWETVTVVTGPNSGGKTRLLQGIAIAQMLTECGLYAPAGKASLCRSTGLFVSLIEEARADQREGRLGTELIRIRNVFEKSRSGSLVVLDELCSGTNPSEGEEIIRLVLSLLKELGPCVFITTHFLQFAARLSLEEKPAANLSFMQVDLDDEECPTFKFKPGVATTSLAHQTAARLGVTREELQSLVKRNRKSLPGQACE